MLAISNSQTPRFDVIPSPQPAFIPRNPVVEPDISFADQLNQYSETALDSLADFGERWSPSQNNNQFGIAPKTLEAARAFDTVADRVSDLLQVNRTSLSRFGLQAADAVFGVTSVLGTFSDEHKAGSTTYEGTIKEVGYGVLRSSLTSAAGIAAGTAAVGLGLASAPAIIIGGGVALGAGYVINNVIDHFSR